MSTGYSSTLQWDCGLDPWSTERWWPPQLRSSPLDPPLSPRCTPAEETTKAFQCHLNKKISKWSRKKTYKIEQWSGQRVASYRIKIDTSKSRNSGENWRYTFRCAATSARGVLVMRQRSAEPEVGFLALGSNSWPSWWRLNFCWPNPRALRFPLEGQRGHRVGFKICMKTINVFPHKLTERKERSLQLKYSQSLPPGGYLLKPKLFHFP